MSAEIRYDPAHPPVAVLAAAEWLRLAAPAAASASASAAPIQLIPIAGLTPPTITLPGTAQVLSGASLLLRYIGRLASDSHLHLAGRNASEGAQADFFLDLVPLLGNKDTLNKYAQQINDHLAQRTVLVGDSGAATLADFAVWEALTGLDTTLLLPFSLLFSSFKDPYSAGVMLAIEYGVLVSCEIQHSSSPTLRLFPCCLCSRLFVHVSLCAANPRWAAFIKTNFAAQFPHLARWNSLMLNQPALAPALQARQALDQKKAQTKLAKSSEGSGFDVELPGASMGTVVTRFPPEPSGYLHIGQSTELDADEHHWQTLVAENEFRMRN
jgi:hypothetical protein